MQASVDTLIEVKQRGVHSEWGGEIESGPQNTILAYPGMGLNTCRQYVEDDDICHKHWLGACVEHILRKKNEYRNSSPQKKGERKA